MQEDIEKIFEDKRMKIANKMKEITKNKGLIINDYQKREHIDILSDDEIRKIIREKRKEEKDKYRRNIVFRFNFYINYSFGII